VASARFGLRAYRERSAIFTALLLIAYVPLVIWALNPQVGQLARALHATLPLLLVVLAVGIGDLTRWLSTRAFVPGQVANILPAVFCVIVVIDGAITFLHKREALRSDPNYESGEMRLPQTLFADLRAAGIERVYLYDNAFYGLHWYFSLKKHFNALPFFVENPEARPEPDVRMIQDLDTLKSVVSSGKARLVIMRRPAFEIAEVYRKREDDFLSWAPKLGGKQWAGFGRIPTFPPNLFVYEFAPSK
jgi:hypothetical protein